MGIVVVIGITLQTMVRGKADGFHAPEGSSPGPVTGDRSGYHRGLRAEHVFRGVARERGRATCFLVQVPDWGARLIEKPWRGSGASTGSRAGNGHHAHREPARHRERE
jgi:hypothetical protein